MLESVGGPGGCQTQSCDLVEVVGRVAAPADCSLCKHGAHIEQPVQMAFLFEVLSFTWRKCEILRDKLGLILAFLFSFFVVRSNAEGNAKTVCSEILEPVYSMSSKY